MIGLFGDLPACDGRWGCWQDGQQGLSGLKDRGVTLELENCSFGSASESCLDADLCGEAGLRERDSRTLSLYGSY